MDADLAETNERLARQETEMHNVRVDLAEQKHITWQIANDVALLVSDNKRRKESMDALDKIVGAGMVLRWTIIFVVSTLAAIATAATAWEALQKWLR